MDNTYLLLIENPHIFEFKSSIFQQAKEMHHISCQNEGAHMKETVYHYLM